jgi:ribose transport system permease protein
MMKKGIVNIIKTFIFPVVIWLFFAVLIQLKGGSNIYVSVASIQDILQSSALSVIIAIAVALPLSGGRWDFAPGATMVVTGIIAGNIAINSHLGIIGLVVLSMLTAVILSLFEGIIYILFRVPTMIVSLGIVMLYEAISGLLYDGSGVRLFMYQDLSILAIQPYCYIIMIIVLVVFWALMKYTKFGFDTKSLGNNAMLAVNNGVNEKKNILLTYIVVGMFLGIAALLNASKAVVSPEANLSSTNLVFGSMGAVLVGLYLARFSNLSLGLLSGTIAMSALSKGLTVYGMPSSLNNIILGIFIALFMGYTTNIEVIRKFFGKSLHKKQI